jgi:hypothetical protein
MKKLTMVLAICALSILFVGLAYSQTATQTFSLAVNSIYKISTSGNPGSMTITDAVPGSDPTPVSDATTTYNITHNNKANGAKITASMLPVLPAGYTLTIGLAGNTPVDISTSTQDAVTSIAAGASSAHAIAYSFSATAAAGPLASVSETVTLTVVGL